MLKTVSAINGFVSPTFSGNVTLSNGNLVIGTSGKGIDFSATPGTGTSELFDDYEEGTWTAADATGVGVTITNNATAKYTKIGRLVIASCNITIGATVSATVAEISLPFAANVDSGNSSQGGVVIEHSYGLGSLAAAIDNTTSSRFRPDGGAGLTYASLSGKNLRYTIIYVEN
jgi:hypothetical protein